MLNAMIFFRAMIAKHGATPHWIRSGNTIEERRAFKRALSRPVMLGRAEIAV